MVAVSKKNTGGGGGVKVSSFLSFFDVFGCFLMFFLGLRIRICFLRVMVS